MYAVHAGEFWSELSRGDGHEKAGVSVKSRKKTEGRRERVKAHVVCFERGFRRSPGGSSSRMFI